MIIVRLRSGQQYQDPCAYSTTQVLRSNQPEK